MSKFLVVLLMVFSTQAFGQQYGSVCEPNPPYPNQDKVNYYKINGKYEAVFPKSDNRSPYYNQDNRQYENWTYVDENGYDYTVVIKVK